MKLGRGAIVVVKLDPAIGHEQQGVRPCVVVSDLHIISDQRFPLLCVVPVTGTPGEGLLYPPLAPGKSGLARAAALNSGVNVLAELQADFTEAIPDTFAYYLTALAWTHTTLARGLITEEFAGS